MSARRAEDRPATAIHFDGVGVRFGVAHGLWQVSFRVPAGCICALVGPNGAGKSTAIRVICGLLRPNSGTGHVLGEPLSARPAKRRAQIGYMAQHAVLYDELSVLENLRFRAQVMGLAAHCDRAVQALQEHGLIEVAAQRVGALSGGWRQRVAFAVAQLARPRLLLLDEPTAGLDAEARTMLWADLRRLVDQDGVTAVVSSHDPAEAALCDQLILLERGSLQFQGPPSERWSAADLASLRSAAVIGMGGTGSAINGIAVSA